jgi:hypothetical protein
VWSLGGDAHDRTRPVGFGPGRATPQRANHDLRDWGVWVDDVVMWVGGCPKVAGRAGAMPGRTITPGTVGCRLCLA